MRGTSCAVAGLTWLLVLHPGHGAAQPPQPELLDIVESTTAVPERCTRRPEEGELFSRYSAALLSLYCTCPQ